MTTRKILPFAAALIIPLIALSVMFRDIYLVKDLVIFPSAGMKSFSYSDKDKERDGRSSVREFAVNRSNIRLRYFLEEGYLRPFAGIQMDIDRKIDYSKYDGLKLKIDSGALTEVRIILHLSHQSSPDAPHRMRDLYLQTEITPKGSSEIFYIGLSDFTVPFWWRESVEGGEYPADRQRFDIIRSIDVRSGISPKIDAENTITIHEIAFVKRRDRPVLFYALFLSVYSMSLFFIFKVLNRRKKYMALKSEQIIPCANLDFIGTDGDCLGRVVKYIGENYSNRMIAVDMVSRGSGVAASEIPVLLKKNYGLSFPKYINRIRLGEARRLLCETDRQVSDIASKVGFFSVHHFNRLFSAAEKCSPVDYRKRNNGMR